jgi:DNA-binding winged helix-turn-helix (wHTH) protein
MRHQQRTQGIGYRFFDFTLTQDNQLMRKSTFIRTGAKELAVLRVLIESAGQLVEKNDLLDKVWGSAIVSEESLARCIYVLRKIFRQDKEKVYIQTIYSKGYVFVAEVCEFIPVPYEISRPYPRPRPSIMKRFYKRSSVWILPISKYPEKNTWLSALKFYYQQTN